MYESSYIRISNSEIRLLYMNNKSGLICTKKHWFWYELHIIHFSYFWQLNRNRFYGRLNKMDFYQMLYVLLFNFIELSLQVRFQIFSHSETNLTIFKYFHPNRLNDESRAWTHWKQSLLWNILHKYKAMIWNVLRLKGRGCSFCLFPWRKIKNLHQEL